MSSLSSAPETGAAPMPKPWLLMGRHLSSAPETGAAPMAQGCAHQRHTLSSAPETGAAPIDVAINPCTVYEKLPSNFAKFAKSTPIFPLSKLFDGPCSRKVHTHSPPPAKLRPNVVSGNPPPEA